MNLTKSFLLFFAFLCYFYYSAAQSHKLLKEADLDDALEAIKTDSILKLQRSAALLFHEILNDYRSQNGLQKLDWNDVLWLVCQNHSYYMLYNDDLCHTEKKGKDFFSGTEPGDRLNFVLLKNDLDWNAENALYNRVSQESPLYDMASKMAESSFHLWKNSFGHNRNMLNRASRIHAVAFQFEDGLFYATSLFGYAITSPIPEQYGDSSDPLSNMDFHSINLNKDARLKTGSKKISNANISEIRKYIESNFDSEILELETDKSIVRDKALMLASRKHARYIYTNNTISNKENSSDRNFYAKDLAKRVAKAEGKRFWFLRMRTDIVEYVSVNEFEANNLTSSMIIQSFKEKLIFENDVGLKKIERFGFSVKLKKIKDRVKVYSVLLVKYKDHENGD
jgi:uncharacterized protein YkwD